MTSTQTIQISEATYNALMEESSRRGITPEELIRSVLPATDLPSDLPEDTRTVGEILRAEGLIGAIDSSQPNDPDSPPQRPPLYYLLAEKFRKQGLKLP